MCILLYNLLFQFTQFPGSMEHLKLRNKTWRSYYRWNTKRPHEWTTAGPVMEPCFLLKIASTVQSSPPVILMLIFIRPRLGLLLQVCTASREVKGKKIFSRDVKMQEVVQYERYEY